MVQALDDARRRQTRSASRVPPHDLPAEESLLGAMLLSKDAIASAVEVCEAADFYKPSHGHIFEAVTSLYGQGEPADPVTVADELRRAGLLEAIGGPSVLTELQANTPAVSNAGRYGRIVADHAVLRRLIGVAGEIAELGYSVPDDVEEAVDRAETLVYEVADRRAADTLLPLNELLRASLDHLEQLYERGESITGTPTGYHDLDDILAGLQPSTLNVVGARPGAGKTSFALGMAAHAAIEARRPVLVFSLEMSHHEVTQRLLSAEARVDATRLRNGRLLDTDWNKINHAIGRLSDSPLYIDDNPNLTVMEIRAKARRLRSRMGDLGLIIVDYLQLMTGRRNAENRQVEVSEISRGLKILARELEVPVVALSQLSRNLETRADKRPVLADLRESGCLTADSRVLRADTGVEVTLAELLVSGERDIPVWSLDENLKMIPATMTHVFPSGVKPVFELRLASGRRVTASANHPFLTLEGWTRLDELTVGARVAVPRLIPEPVRLQERPEAEVVLLAHLLGDGCFASRQPLHYTSCDPANLSAVEEAAGHFGVTPRRVRQGTWSHVYLPSPYRLTHGRRNPIRVWLAGFGLDGLRSHEKFIPRDVFQLPKHQVALFIQHLWATDGCVWQDDHQNRVYYASTSRRLVEDLQQLLLRFEIQSRIGQSRKHGHRPGFTLDLIGAENMLKFVNQIGVHGARGDQAASLGDRLAGVKKHAYSDSLPVEVWKDVRSGANSIGMPTSLLAEKLGFAGQPFRSPPSRERLARAAAVLDSPNLRRLAHSDIHWDRVVAITAMGEQDVYDATVLETHNFVANGITVENSIEQDSDVVLFIYRDELYHADSADRGTAEIIVSKHRNGPTGVTRLAFIDRYTRFANMARE